jgi:hypothetical protein
MNESVMIVVTAASLALAVAMGIIVAMVFRHERRRSDARAAMLAEMAAESSASFDDGFDLRDEFRPELEVAPANLPDLFATPAARSAWPRRLAIVAGLAVVLAVVGSLARGAFPQSSPRADVARSTDPALLDLLSLQHTQEAGALTITGLVQNPRTGTPLSKVVATAMVFGADETFIASGRTALDLTMLRPGDESGFVISVPVSPSVATTIARYRIGFRGEDGRIIGHVDRRMSTAIARGPS